MSNMIDNEAPEVADSLRSDSFDSVPVVEVAPVIEKGGFKVKAPIKTDFVAPTTEEKTYSAADVVEMAKQIEESLRKRFESATFKSGESAQVMSRSKAPLVEVDFSKLSMDAIYDLSIPIEAKAFGATDALRVELLDKNYEARWVNTNPMRLGKFLAFGFIFVEKQDLEANLEAEVNLDANGHFVIQDVVLMRIPKQKYYAALRAAHQRAVNTVSSVGSTKAATQVAEGFMAKESGGEFAMAAQEGKVGFYRPGIEI